jgi:hypothetical protein
MFVLAQQRMHAMIQACRTSGGKDDEEDARGWDVDHGTGSRCHALVRVPAGNARLRAIRRFGGLLLSHARDRAGHAHAGHVSDAVTGERDPGARDSGLARDRRPTDRGRRDDSQSRPHSFTNGRWAQKAGYDSDGQSDLLSVRQDGSDVRPRYPICPARRSAGPFLSGRVSQDRAGGGQLAESASQFAIRQRGLEGRYGK